MDPRLATLAAAAQRGDPCPTVRLVIGGQVVVGTPTNSRQFFERSWDAWTDEVWASLGAPQTTRKKGTAEREGAFKELTEPTTAAVRAARDLEPPAEEAITLADAQWLPSQGGGLRIPVLRVPLTAIEAWWLGGGEAIKTSGGWWAFGAVVPIDIGQ